MKNYLISVDMEGIHGVVGEEYKGFNATCKDYPIATANAVKEINTVIAALIEEGADNIYVWDNHGGKDNIDFSMVHEKAIKITTPNPPLKRLDFLKDLNICGNIFLGYHAREGTLNGVLAHTYSSADNQYYKLNGKQVGEFEMDSIFAAEYGVPSIFFASDDVCVNQIKESHPDIETVITKIGKGRNAATFIDEATVLKNIYNGVKRAVNRVNKTIDFSFPCELEVRYTRMEWAETYYKRNNTEYGINVQYGEDCHVLKTTIHNPFELKLFL